MFTASVLSSIKDPELRKTLHLDETDKEHVSQVVWLRDSLGNIEKALDRIKYGPDPTSRSLQQSDLLRTFYLTIAEKGLQYAYDHSEFTPDDLPPANPNPATAMSAPPPAEIPKENVIIVGAGMSGLVAAYELKKAGYNVKILEMSQRFGGRVKTLDYKDGFDRGLHTDAGAMRLPQTPNKDRPVREMIHYLSDYYAMKEFNLTPVPFKNEDSRAFYNFYDEQTKISEWKDEQFSVYWPGWDARLKETGQNDITNLDDYFEKTVGPVIQILKNRLKGIVNLKAQAAADQWNCWTMNWCQFSLASFLRSTLASIRCQLNFDKELDENLAVLNELDLYLPWPEMAITGYLVFNYTPSPDISLVTALQDSMGKWWSDKMHSLEGGLSALPNAFAAAKPGDSTITVEEMITYNRTVMKVEYEWDRDAGKSVTVSGVITSSNQPFSITGRSIILTVPLHVLRGIQIVNRALPPKFPREFQQAIENVTYTPSTKIMLQYKKRFWNDDVITGGFSKTNMPIGQLHYPTEVVIDGNGDWIPKPVTKDEKGILMVYTWKAEALLWGALEESQAIMLAITQIEKIHPNTSKLFEVGRRQAWASDPTTLGAFALLRPEEYICVIYLMQNSWKNVYFGGEAISFANGWIQGALESGLRAAYQLFRDDQNGMK